jgi:hypothetical protein
MRSVLGLLAAAVIAAMASTSLAAILSFTDTTGDPVTVNALPGDSFQIKAVLTLGAGEDACGVAFRLHASDSGVFTITARTVEAGNPFTLLTTPDPTLPAKSPGLDPANGSDLGGLTPDIMNHSPGTFSLYTFTIAISPTAALKSYQITGIEVSYTNNVNNQFDEFTTVEFTPGVYNVAVPEPVFVGMMGVAAGGLMLRRRAREIDGE